MSSSSRYYSKAVDILRAVHFGFVLFSLLSLEVFRNLFFFLNSELALEIAGPLCRSLRLTSIGLQFFCYFTIDIYSKTIKIITPTLPNLVRTS